VIDRRTFIATVAGGLLAGPLAVEAQQAGKVYRIGFIGVGHNKPQDALIEGLGALGYVEGRNLVIERRFSEGKAERFPEFAAEMVRLMVDIIIVDTTPAAIASRNATKTIPIVIPTAIDPVGAGLVASLGRPGGNLTGLSLLSSELSAKRLELLKEVVPGLSRVAVLWNGANPANAIPWRETQSAGRALGIVLQSRTVSGPNGFEATFAMIAKERPDALLAIGDALVTGHQKQIVDFVTQNRVPSMYPWREPVVAGGLMSYGPSFADALRQVGSYTGRILKGEKPSDLPVMRPTKFEFVINLKTAKALGLAVPAQLLAIADEAIE
jgi:putative ABC transport system substrate-binding protein